MSDVDEIKDPQERIGWMLGALVRAMDNAGKKDRPLTLSAQQCRAYAATIDREMNRT